MDSATIFPGDLAITDFDYELPRERIANFPLEQRDQSKLLVYRNEQVKDSCYQNLASHLPGGALMVFNETKVVQARLQFVQSNGTKIEIFCLEPASTDEEISNALQKTGSIHWRCLVGDFRKWKEPVLSKLVAWGSGRELELKAELVQKVEGIFIIHFQWNDQLISFADILEHAGQVPLPPYIKREAGDEDRERYQTIFSRNEGSVAAPTAGLHYTTNVLQSLKEKGINIEYLTLHVGAGTFKPVKASIMKEHDMHSEQIILKKEFLKTLLKYTEQEIVAVGTTSARTLESIYWLGLKIYLKKINDRMLIVDQWDPYLLSPVLSVAAAIHELISYLDKIHEEVLVARTKIIIAPGYHWKLVNILATNFHQPKSTLILLVASFVGDVWKDLYNHALKNDYRFLSYGDGCLLFRC
jgi:S-adenosylmethionine:tRNA ribosyltransferase-isomerase